VAEHNIDQVVEAELNDHVDEFQRGDWQRGFVEWTDTVEKWVDEQPQGPEERMVEEVALQNSGNIHVHVFVAQVPVVVCVVFLVGDGDGDAHWQVAEHAQCPVPTGSAVSECQVVSDLVDGTAQGMVQAASDTVRSYEQHRPTGVLDQVAHRHLENHFGGDEDSYHGVITHEFLDFWVFLEDSFAPGSVWFLRVLPVMVSVFNLQPEFAEVVEELQPIHSHV